MPKKKDKKPLHDDDDALLDAAIAANAKVLAAAAPSVAEPQISCGSTEVQLSLELRPGGVLGKDGVHGCLHEKDGRLFYDLMACLTTIALPQLNLARAKMKQPPLEWDRFDTQANDLSSRGVVQQYVLGHIDKLVDQAESGAHDAVFESILQRRVQPRDKAILRQWRAHLEADFFVCGFVDDGAVFVQLCESFDGVLADDDQSRDTDLPFPRVFVVKALATPLSEVLRDMAVQLKTDVVAVRTVLLPFRQCVTYMSTMLPPACAQRWTPARMDAAVARARDAYAQAVARRAVFRQLDRRSGMTSSVAASTATSIVDSRYAAASSSGIKVQPGASGSARMETAPAETIAVHMTFWMPYEKWDDPRTEAAMQAALHSTEAASRVEGVKRGIVQRVPFVRQDGGCVFCGGKPCTAGCLRKHEERQRQATRRLDGRHEMYFYDPIDEPTADALSKQPVDDLFAHMLVSPLAVHEVSVRIPTRHVELVRARLDGEDGLFHRTCRGKWDYKGFFLLCCPGLGMLTFGDVTLSDDGLFAAEAMTARRAHALIEHLKHLTVDLDVSAAQLVAKPHHRASIDEETLHENERTLGAGLGKVQVTIDKDGGRGQRRCAYCGAAETDQRKLRRCAKCHAVAYCSPACQKDHWKKHRPQCKEAVAARAREQSTQS